MVSAAETLLIFDLDGTLFQTEKVSYRAAVECFNSFGLEKPERDEIVDWFGKPIHEFMAWVVIKVGGAASPEEVLEEFSRLEFALIPEVGELFPGVMDSLELLKREGYRLALCSNGSEDYVDLVTGEMEIRGLFEKLSHRVDRHDPKTARIAQLKEHFNPSRGMVVGDREDDISSARDNGLLSLGCLYGYARKGELDEADALIRDSVNLADVVLQVLAEAEGAERNNG